MGLRSKPQVVVDMYYIFYRMLEEQVKDYLVFLTCIYDAYIFRKIYRRMTMVQYWKDTFSVLLFNQNY